jgi:Mrp family chromosome partitioning ATPase
MSRDFELLQRLRHTNANASGAAASPRVAPIATCNTPIVGTRPTCHLGEGARNELSKVSQRLFLMGPAEFQDCVVFSAVDDDVDAFWIACCVGDVLSTQTTRSVCVIDANIGNERSYPYLPIESTTGFTHAVSKSVPFIEVASRVAENLWIVASGDHETASESPISSPRLEEMISEARTQFDFVLIATAPLVENNDCATLGRIAHGAVLVLEANATRRESAERAKQTLINAQVRLLGAILNNRTMPIPSAIYSRL